jgi:hypothetical protein
MTKIQWHLNAPSVCSPGEQFWGSVTLEIPEDEILDLKESSKAVEVRLVGKNRVRWRERETTGPHQGETVTKNATHIILMLDSSTMIDAKTLGPGAHKFFFNCRCCRLMMR